VSAHSSSRGELAAAHPAPSYGGAAQHRSPRALTEARNEPASQARVGAPIATWAWSQLGEVTNRTDSKSKADPTQQQGLDLEGSAVRASPSSRGLHCGDALLLSILSTGWPPWGAKYTMQSGRSQQAAGVYVGSHGQDSHTPSRMLGTGSHARQDGLVDCFLVFVRRL
jgi:hypothetical protein